jgi:hypothetical protein
MIFIFIVCLFFLIKINRIILYRGNIFIIFRKIKYLFVCFNLMFHKRINNIYRGTYAVYMEIK